MSAEKAMTHHAAVEQLLPAECAEGACDHDGACQTSDRTVCVECTARLTAVGADEVVVLAKDCPGIHREQAPREPLRAEGFHDVLAVHTTL